MAECFPLPSSTFPLTGIRSVPVRAPIQAHVSMQPEVRTVSQKSPPYQAQVGLSLHAKFGAPANGEAGAKAVNLSAAAMLARSSARSVPVGSDGLAPRLAGVSNGEVGACDGLQHLPSSAALHEHTPRHTASSQYLITEENDISEYMRDGEKDGLRNASHMELETLEDSQRKPL
jgi:hypothetical protein